MTAKLSSIVLLAASTAIATAQTTTTKPATTATHHTATTTAAAKSTTPPNIPKVVGIPKTIYALKYVDTLVGTGPLAEPSILGTSQADSKIMWYTVKYTGWLTDGTKFDSSYDHPGAQPITFPQGVHRVIPGWDTGFQGMHIGGKRRLFISYQLAYGEAGKPPVIPAKSDLIFDIELVSVSDKPPAPPVDPNAPSGANTNSKPADPEAKPSTTRPTDPAAKPSTTTPSTDPAAKPPTTTPQADPAKPETTPHPQSL
jgi:peptidylprolyl isomerase